MKYMILVYNEPNAFSPEEHRACVQESTELCRELHVRGQYLGASPLQPPPATTTVRVRSGKPIVSDGPFTEAKEVLGGYFLVDVPTLDEAIAVAARIPGARRGTVEIRPLLDAPGLPQIEMRSEPLAK
jgi:hypothetical protein